MHSAWLNLNPAEIRALKDAFYDFEAPEKESILSRRLYFSFDFAILTPPPILEVSKPIAISKLFINTVHQLDLLVTHTKPQLPTLRNHLVMVSQSQI